MTLLMPDDLLAELERTLGTKPYLKTRITPEQAHVFVTALRAIAELLPAIPEPLPRVVRDPHDDYLLAAAVFAEAEILVTGDDDLLALRPHLDHPRIMTAAEALALVSAS